MSLIEKINELAKSSLIEAKLIAAEEGVEVYRKPIDHMVDLSKKIDKSELARMSNFDIFMIFTHLFNGNMYSYYETLEYASDIKDAINSWTFEKNAKDIIELYNYTSSDGSFTSPQAYKSFSNLGLSTIFVNYNMKSVYECMYYFLNFKNIILNSESISKVPFTQRIQHMNRLFKETRFKDYVEYAEKMIKKDAENYEFRRDVANKRIEYLTELLAQIEDGSFDSICEIPNTWHSYIDVTVLESIYELIQSNLLRKYQALEQEEKDLLSKTNKTALTSYLYSKNLNPDSLHQDKLSTLESIPRIVEYIKFLESLNIPTIEVLTIYYDYLINLTDEKISYIKSLININALSRETIKTNPSILSELFLTIKTNYEILKNIIDFNSIFYDDNILLKSSIEIKEIISVLSRYALSKNNYIFLLCNYNYLNIYDLVLENGISEELFISICKTSNPLNTIKRIKIYINLEEQYEAVGNYLKKDVTCEEKFVCDDDDLDSYLPNVVTEFGLNILAGKSIGKIESSSIVKELDEKYQRSQNIYIIGGVKISRPKFLRNFELASGNEELLVASLVSNSILDSKEYFSLTNELSLKQLKK